ncbi:hypothetical protein ABPG77_008599, partial [Micractinium sp. CCAP 211/92]
MSTTPARTTRRSARAAAAAAEVSDSPAESPEKDAPTSPVGSHPIRDEPGSAGKPAGRGKNGAKESDAAKSSGGFPVYLLLAVLAVAGGVLYTQYAQVQVGSLTSAPADQLQQKPAPQPPLPHVTFTRAEEEVFEKACEEHYNSPPSAALSPGEEAAEGEEAAGAADATADRALLEAGEDSGPVDEIASAVHAGYLALPPWPAASEEELTGSWKLTEEVYNYAASHPMAQVLSREKPRVMLLPSFLSPEEVDHMIRISRTTWSAQRCWWPRVRRACTTSAPLLASGRRQTTSSPASRSAFTAPSASRRSLARACM